MIYYLIDDLRKANASAAIYLAPEDYVCEIKQRTRTLDQNAYLHAILADIQKSETPISHYSIEDMKLIFMHALREESRFLPALDGNGVFPAGQRTSKLNKGQFSALCEIVNAYGAKHGVRWSAKSLNVFEQERN